MGIGDCFNGTNTWGLSAEEKKRNAQRTGKVIFLHFKMHFSISTQTGGILLYLCLYSADWLMMGFEWSIRDSHLAFPQKRDWYLQDLLKTKMSCLWKTHIKWTPFNMKITNINVLHITIQICQYFTVSLFLIRTIINIIFIYYLNNSD